VHGLHYLGDKLAVLCRAAGWLTDNGLLVAVLDPASIRLPDGRPVGRALTTALRQAGFHYDPRRHRITRTALTYDGGTHLLSLADGSKVRSRAVIIASGVSYRRLPVPDLEPLVGAGVLYGARPWR
jgi:alkyl hydroperoxide reductase subunit AhpF